MSGDILELYKDVEDGKLAYIMTVGDKKLYAASCPTFGDEYKAMMIVVFTDENGISQKFRYDLFSGKQIVIEEEYSTIKTADLRAIEKALGVTYVGNVSDKVHTFYQSFLYNIDMLNQNTKGWASVSNNPDYKEIPKFSNKRKPTAKKTK